MTDFDAIFSVDCKTNESDVGEKNWKITKKGAFPAKKVILLFAMRTSEKLTKIRGHKMSNILLADVREINKRGLVRKRM